MPRRNPLADSSTNSHATPTDSKPSPNPVRVIASTSLISSACVLPAFLLGAMAVQVSRDIGITAFGIGLAFAAFFAAAALASAPGGRLADRSNPAVVARLAALLSSAMSLVVAGFARSLPVIVICLAIAGAANAVCQTAANLIIVRALPAHRHGFALAVKQSAIPGAAMLAGVAVPAVALTLGWRWAFVLAACLAWATAAWLPRDHRTRPPRARRTGVTEPRPRPDTPMRTMVLLALAASLAGTVASALGSFLVSAAVDADLAEDVAGLLLTASAIAGIAVRLIAGARADRRTGGHFRVVTIMIAGGAIAFALLAVGAPVVYLLAAPLAFCTAWAWPGLFNLAVVRVNPSSPASATGITQTGQFVGGVVGPLLFGFVADYAGFQPAWLLASGIAAAGAVALIIATKGIDEGSPIR